MKAFSSVACLVLRATPKDVCTACLLIGVVSRSNKPMSTRPCKLGLEVEKQIPLWPCDGGKHRKHAPVSCSLLSHKASDSPLITFAGRCAPMARHTYRPDVGTLVSCTDVLTVAPAYLLVLIFYDTVQVRYCFEAIPRFAVGRWVHSPSGG